MMFYKNPSGGPSSLILHKNEWNRLKKQAGPPEEPSQVQNEYLKALKEKSQAWMKTWPDTVQGCVAKIEKQKEKQRAEEIAAVKAFSMKKVNKHSEEAIQKAKQSIFDESCYGKKLLSALRESKALEERDVQIQFMKEIKEKEAELELKQTKTVRFCTFDLDKNEADKKEKQKYITMRNSNENKEMYKKKKTDAAKAKEQEKLSDLENAQLIKYLLDCEQEAEDKIKHLEKQVLEEYAAENKKSKEERAKWEAEYYAQIEECHKEQAKLNCKIKQVLQGINKASQDPTIIKVVYEKVEKCQKEEKKRFDDFIEKSNKIGEERADKREQIAKEKEKQDYDKKVSIAEINKKMAEYVRQRECSNKCFCDRQCFIVKSDRERNMKKGKGEMEYEVKEVQQPYVPVPNGRCNKLVSALKRREKEPSPWTGTSTAHVHFAKVANDVLRECKYKKPGRKVVDEYRKYNGFDATTLPIANY